MGASHPSRLVDEQEKSAEPGDVWDSLDGAGREEPLRLSLPPLPCSLSQSRAHLQGGLFLL